MTRAENKEERKKERKKERERERERKEGRKEPVAVAQACSPSYLGGLDGRIA